MRNDTKRIRYKFARKYAINDWDALLNQMQDVLTNEDELAQFLTNKFWELSDLAKRSLGNGVAVAMVRQKVA